MNAFISQVVFFLFAAVLVGSATMTIASRHPVRSALSLVLAFFASAGLWLLLEAEFLGLVLLLVYVGAVMTLFLFVIMMLNVEKAALKQNLVVKHVFCAVAIVISLVGMTSYVAITRYSGDASLALSPGGLANSESNTQALGDVLYTVYAYPFELAGVLLLLAIISAISLASRQQKSSKALAAAKQIVIQRKDRIRLTAMKKAEKE